MLRHLVPELEHHAREGRELMVRERGIGRNTVKQNHGLGVHSIDTLHSAWL